MQNFTKNLTDLFYIWLHVTCYVILFLYILLLFFTKNYMLQEHLVAIFNSHVNVNIFGTRTSSSFIKVTPLNFKIIKTNYKVAGMSK